MSTGTIIAFHSVHDSLKAHEVEVTKDLLERKKYFDDQRSKALSAEKTKKAEARRKVSEDIEIVNTEIRQTLSVIKNLKMSSDEIRFSTEKSAAFG